MSAQAVRATMGAERAMKNRGAWGLELMLVVGIGVVTGVGFRCLQPGSIMLGPNAALSWHPTWRFGYFEGRRPRTGVVFVRTVYGGFLTVAYWPPTPMAPGRKKQAPRGVAKVQ